MSALIDDVPAQQTSLNMLKHPTRAVLQVPSKLLNTSRQKRQADVRLTNPCPDAIFELSSTRQYVSHILNACRADMHYCQPYKKGIAPSVH